MQGQIKDQRTWNVRRPAAETLYCKSTGGAAGSAPYGQIFDLENMMNKAYNANSFKTLCEQQIFHKLSYKNKHAQYTNKGVRTLYHMLISK